MGVVNVTPDSFSDGGKFLNANAAVRHALQLIEQGAEILDLGGESTRPKAKPVSEKEELRRVIPVIKKLAPEIEVPISIDTMKPAVARAALAAGALCKRLGLAVNIAAKMSESSLASAATVHLACAVENIDWGVSLTHFYLAEDIVRRPLAMTDGLVSLPLGAGLGVDVDEAAVARLRVG